ncbi:protein CLEC16A homolog [Phlebotomus argentipes]|uniref:protein CLEC16A homolog n=1 Tax=Phlebotomus argentipes TaxID=94469 RepID=UPI0028930318|nr:protein CLEC16A homolog [Phlebotomus argentipes]
MFRSRSWFGANWNKPKNRLSLEHMKYLYSVLEKNMTVSEHNRGLLVETLRSIAEILIWGDQHDSSVFDFFLEKNMLSYFIHIMRQKNGGPGFVCVQLLQTLNILFENIRNETSLYYLLSNNQVNSIIVHKFDFSDEDVMGYYILFLKTLSLKLNKHTIHFFYNEHTNDFPLYTEAIKFFNHPESMVRIAVRTISLNVYRVQNTNMLQFIRDRTAAPYFSNLVWFIGNHILELDACVRNDTDHQSQSRLSNLVAEHLDHLHYINDIFCLEIDDLNAVLTEHLLHKLFVPLYIFSLTPAPSLSIATVTQNLAAVLNKVVEIEDIQEVNNPRVSVVTGFFLLAMVFLVIKHPPLVQTLAWVIFNADNSIFKEGLVKLLDTDRKQFVSLGFAEPQESLERALETTLSATNSDTNISSHEEDPTTVSALPEHSELNRTDEEKEKMKGVDDQSVTNRPFLDTVISAMDCADNDYLALLALCLIYAVVENSGVDREWLEKTLNSSSSCGTKCKTLLVEKLLKIAYMSSTPASRIRLVTLELNAILIQRFTRSSNSKYDLSEGQHAMLTESRYHSMNVVKFYYKSEDIFLDLFEDEYNEMSKSALNVEFLCADSTILLPPTGTPLTGIMFTRRLPCGDVEKARRAIRVFLYLRRLCHTIFGEIESLLPLTNQHNCVDIDDVLDLNNSDLIACTIIMKDGQKQRRFLVIDVQQLILVEPDLKRLGWGIAKIVGFLQDTEVGGDKDDTRCLHLTISRGGATRNQSPLLSAKLVFDDYIRCMAAKQRLTKGRSKVRQKKMLQIAQILEIKEPSAEGSNAGIATSGRITLREHRPLFSTANRVPGFAAALRLGSMPSAGVSRVQIGNRSSLNSSGDGRNSPSSSSYGRHTPRRDTEGSLSSSTSRPGTRDSSPRTPRPRSEEIPLEDLRRSASPGAISRSSASSSWRPATPSKLSMEKPGHEEGNGKVDGQEDKLVSNTSEETSFIAGERKSKKSSTIQTV